MTTIRFAVPAGRYSPDHTHTLGFVVSERRGVWRGAIGVPDPGTH
jgi:hypothetical protein